MADLTPLRTTNATPTVLATIAPTDAADGFTVWEFRIIAIATSGARAGYIRTAGIKQSGGTVSLVGSVGTPLTVEDVAGWDCTVTIAGNVVQVLVTGAGATTVDWYLQAAGPLAGMGPLPFGDHPAIPHGCGWSV